MGVHLCREVGQFKTVQPGKDTSGESFGRGCEQLGDKQENNSVGYKAGCPHGTGGGEGKCLFTQCKGEL